ncbi:MAG TPA: hypothetical protein HPP77_04970 [Candidatus Hydrogenedentes bacterium]|nr:hypothetical protein [Candidatus Hydrogenedentota bacterium]
MRYSESSRILAASRQVLLLSILFSGYGAPAAMLDADAVPGEDIERVATRLGDDYGTRLDAAAQKLLEEQVRVPDSDERGSFPGIDPEDWEDPAYIRGYFDPIVTLAQVYASAGSRYHKSQDVGLAIHDALRYARKHVYPGRDRTKNWFVWEKKLPQLLPAIMGLVYHDLSPEDQAYLRAIMDDLIPNRPVAHWGRHHGKTAGDALAMLKVGVVLRDRRRIAYAWDAMANYAVPFFTEPDGAAVMNTIGPRPDLLALSLPYTYEGCTKLVQWRGLTSGTSLDMPQHAYQTVVRYLLDFNRWNLFGDAEVAWLSMPSYTVYYRPPRSLPITRAMATVDLPGAADLKAMVDRTAAPPDGVRFWPSVEVLIYRSPGFYCALGLASKNWQGVSWIYKDRVPSHRVGNKWYYMRDGHTVLAGNPNDTDPDLTFTFNWRRLSGTTADDASVLQSPQLGGYDNPDWQPQWIVCENPVAGAAVLDERQAAAGIEVHSGDIRARKSYYFLRDRDMIVALGGGIEGRNRTDTTVHTFPIPRDARAELVVNGEPRAIEDGLEQVVQTPAWVHGPRGGYYFPETGAVTLSTETRQPDFEDQPLIGQDQRAKIKPQRFLSLYFDHGENPRDKTYAYAYWPGAALENMQGLADDFAGTAAYGREPAGHYLRFGSYCGFAFFEPGTLDGYAADRPCFITADMKDDEVRLAYREPAHEPATLTLGLPFRAAAQVKLPESCRIEGNTLTVQTEPAWPVTLVFRRQDEGLFALDVAASPTLGGRIQCVLPEPLPRLEDFEGTRAGQTPRFALLLDPQPDDTILVTTETAASGRHALKLVDGQPEQPYYEPELAYDVFFREGTAVVSYDVRLESGAVFRNDLRDLRGIQGVGPCLLFKNGKLIVADRVLIDVPEGEWFHVALETPLGRAHTGSFDLTVTLPDQPQRTFTGLPCIAPDFADVLRCFFSGYGTNPSHFYLDNIDIAQR